MIENCPTLTAFIRQLQRVPFLASKNIFRVTEYFLKMDNKSVELFIKALSDLKTNITKCFTCFAYKESSSNCIYCNSTKREKNVICVVENFSDLISIEKTGGYRGTFHVLGGVICPLENVNPEDLTIVQLIKRVEALLLEPGHNVIEIIFAFGQTPECEATAAFIASKLRGKSVEISCLARGLPVGSSIEAMDRVTVFKALSERRPF